MKEEQWQEWLIPLCPDCGHTVIYRRRWWSLELYYECVNCSSRWYRIEDLREDAKKKNETSVV